MTKLFSLYHLMWAFFGNIIYGFPSKKLVVIGVTGTKGKSTTVELISATLEAGGHSTAFFNSVRKKIGTTYTINRYGNSMPGRCVLQQFFSDAVRMGCTHAVIEVTSQGVLQHRHRYIAWNAGVFLNLAPEHIEAHGSFENYRDAKVLFFHDAARSSKSEKLFFINSDDASAQYFEDAVRNVSHVRSIYFSGKKHIIQFQNPYFHADFNIENASAALAVSSIYGVENARAIHALEIFEGVPGRLQFITHKPFAVVVDYAHTPESLEKLYTFLRASVVKENARLIGVLGSCGGGRDMWKRPVMAEIAARLCDRVIFTNEDPFDEDPQVIIADMQKGVREIYRSKIETTLDRKGAMVRAITRATAGDVVVITGKGSEPYLRVTRGEKIPWSDVDIARDILGIKK